MAQISTYDHGFLGFRDGGLFNTIIRTPESADIIALSTISIERWDTSS